MPGSPAIWVGSWVAAISTQKLKRLGIGAVLNVAPSVVKDPVRSYERAGIAYAEIDAKRDDETFPLLERCLRPTSAFLERHTRTGVLVHCQAGRNRSAALVVCRRTPYPAPCLSVLCPS